MRGGRFKRAAGSLVALATLVVISSAQTESSGFYGHICNTTADCKFQGALCDEALKVCQCQPEVPISNQHDKCGKAASFNDVCTFDEQCKELDYQTECKNGRCACIVESEQRISADGGIVCDSMNGRHGDQCSTAADCHFKYSVCTEIQKTCQCHPDMPITNYHDKCGKPASINESCSFNEQCEAAAYKTECRNDRCSCKFEMVPKITADGGIVCTQVKADEGPHRTLDPAMIGVLVGMALMFVIICVVLRLFSKARWRENRTIFNTPNPRLMNVSLLRDSKHSQDKDRRGSRVSVRPPSRQASQQELRPHSPSPARPHQSHQLHRKPSGSRRGSRASSGHSATSLRSATIRSPTTPGPASVTVEIRAPDA